MRPLSAIARDRTALSIWGTATGSWLVLLIWSESPYSAYLGHGELGAVSAAIQLVPMVSFFVLGWSFMVLAMMLPTVLPLVKEFRRRNVSSSAGRFLTTAMASGAVGLWVPFGIAMYFVDLGIHRAADLPPLQGNTWVLGFASLALAGAYQFTRAKSQFLSDCCYPSDFLQSRGRKSLTFGGAIRTGLSYGRASMGSHWALMLLMFSLALQSFPLMLLFGLAMAVEHQSKFGPRARIPIGVAILALAVFFGAASAGI